jgi:hypothetical protein
MRLSFRRREAVKAIAPPRGEKPRLVEIDAEVEAA